MPNDIERFNCRRVYVVDDDDVVLSSTEALLAQSGYTAICYTSARRFLAETPLHSHGCVIADVQMPEMSGVELMRRLADSRSTLAVIVISGVADVPTTVHVMQHGAATLIEKPYDQAELLRAVDSALERSWDAWHQHQTVRQLQERLAALSTEERAVLTRMLRNDPNKAIASELGLSLRTVDRRRHAVLAKMQVQSVPELATLLGTAQFSLQDDATSCLSSTHT